MAVAAQQDVLAELAVPPVAAAVAAVPVLPLVVAAVPAAPDRCG